jgi:ABC-type amino acid transport substrate-binding protein
MDGWMKCSIALVLLAVLGFGWGKNDASNDLFVVCTLGRVAPMASRIESKNDSFTGLSVEIFREAARDTLGWKEGADFRFECLFGGTLDILQNEILNVNGSCDAFIAATTITPERSEMGVVWAYPYWSGSIGIITRSTPKSTDGWAWTKPFTWSFWLAIGLTVIILPAIVYYLEVLSIKKSVSVKDSLLGYVEASWRTLWVMIQGETMSVSMLSARVVVIVLAFVALILSASYTANLAAFLTLKSFSSLNSIFDLQGYAVSTVEAYQQRIQDGYGL